MMKDIEASFSNYMVAFALVMTLACPAVAQDADWAKAKAMQDADWTKAKAMTAPATPIPGLSAEERERMLYAVRVTDARDAGIDQKTREELEWPSRADIGGDLYADKTADKPPFFHDTGNTDGKPPLLRKWLRNFVEIPPDMPVRMMVEKGLENTYCLIGPPDPTFRLRLWRDPYNKGAWRPQRVDLLLGMPPDRSMVDAALGEVLSLLKEGKGAPLANLRRAEGTTPLAGLTGVIGTLKMFPLQDSLVDLPWKVGEVSRMFDGHVVRVEFLVGGPREPLRMRLYMGDKGMQVSIQGKQLQFFRGGVFEPLWPDEPPMPDLSPAGIARMDAEGMLKKLAHWEVSEPGHARAMVSGLARIGSEHPELAPMILKGIDESRARVSASIKLSEEDKRIAMIHYDSAEADIRKAMKAAWGGEPAAGEGASTTRPAPTEGAPSRRPSGAAEVEK
jgi:hypothetical protein